MANSANFIFILLCTVLSLSRYALAGESSSFKALQALDRHLVTKLADNEIRYGGDSFMTYVMTFYGPTGAFLTVDDVLNSLGIARGSSKSTQQYLIQKSYLASADIWFVGSSYEKQRSFNLDFYGKHFAVGAANEMSRLMDVTYNTKSKSYAARHLDKYHSTMYNAKVKELLYALNDRCTAMREKCILTFLIELNLKGSVALELLDKPNVEVIKEMIEVATRSAAAFQHEHFHMQSLSALSKRLSLINPGWLTRSLNCMKLLMSPFLNIPRK